MCDYMEYIRVEVKNKGVLRSRKGYIRAKLKVSQKITWIICKSVLAVSKIE